MLGFGVPRKAEAVPGCVTAGGASTSGLEPPVPPPGQPGDQPGPTDAASSLREKGVFLWIGVDLDPTWWRGKCLGTTSIPVAHSCIALLWIPEGFLWSWILRHWQARFRMGHPEVKRVPTPLSLVNRPVVSGISFSPESQPLSRIMEYPDRGSWSPSPGCSV